jgi:hypothetical protein
MLFWYLFELNYEQIYSLDVWVDRDLLDSTDTISWSLSGDLDVSSFSPWCTPGVSDNEEFLTGSIDTVSDSGDCVVKLGSTISTVKNTRCVSLENWFIGFNSDGDWSDGNGSLKSFASSWGNGVDETDGNVSLSEEWLQGLAPSILSSVWVFSLKSLWMFVDVVHGIWLVSTIATLALKVAVNHLLLSKRKKCTSLEGVVSFNSSSGREGPAWSALTLVLNSVDNTFGSPVNISCESCVMLDDFDISSESLWSSISEKLLVFSFSPRRELVVSNGESVLKVSIDHLVLLFFLWVDSESEVEFLLGSIRDSVGSNVLVELVLYKVEGNLVLANIHSEESGDGTESHFLNTLKMLIIKINYKPVKK